ncbi:hypothetical protein [Pseudomonas xanthosomatis]|uniref:hypothetical protein n=1 Tax=Pseudomonas xanthosomatis TaxID=2842356 RepID=UPI0035169564
MKRTLEGMVRAGEPLLREALEAIRAYHAAQDDGKPPELVESLRIAADCLYRAVVDFQLLEVGKLHDSIH